MSSGTALARLVRRDWEAVRQIPEKDVITCLQSSPKFAPAVNLREQYFNAYNICDTQHQPAVPYSMIGLLFHMSKATVQCFYKHSIEQATVHRSNGRPPILLADEHEDLVPQICQAYAGNEAWTMTTVLGHISEH
jgi:hypothetical protein